MKFVKNRKFAILVSAAIVILATLFGIRGSINRLARKTESMFYDGVYLVDEGYTQPGIDSQLKNRINSALGYALLLESHPELEKASSELLSAQRELIDAESIRAKYSANERLQRAFLKLAENAEKANLSQRDADAAEQYASTFMGAYTMIQNSGYNQQARSYMSGASIFVRIIRPFLFVTPPQLFA